MMNASTDAKTNLVPEPIVRALRRLIRRARMVIVLRGLCGTVATAIGSLIAIMAIDAGVTIFSAWPRWVLMLSALAATGAAAALLLVRPLARSFTLAGIALLIESRHPELQERISSTVELITSDDAPELRGSEALIAALAQEAVRDARGVRPRREVNLRPARPFVIAAAVAAAVLAGLFIAWPQRTAHLWARAVAPYLNLANISAADLKVSPGDVVLAEGQRLGVEVLVANKAVKKAHLRRLAPDGTEAVYKMTSLPQADESRDQ